MALKVLCAFQTEEVFEFVKSSLSGYECDLIKASSEALALFLAQKNFPCLIVCEYQLNNESSNWSLNLLNELKTEAELKTIPVVLLARRPLSTIELPQMDLPRGAEMLMWYPIESYEFCATINPYLIEWKADRLPETPE